MDSYPGDLLVGVTPLVFAVDAILQRSEVVADAATDNATINSNENSAGGAAAAAVANDFTNDFDRQDELGEGPPPTTTSTTTTRSLFERFLDALAGSLDDEEDANASNKLGTSPTPDGSGTGGSFRRGSDALASLFRGDDDDDDDDDDDSEDDDAFGGAGGGGRRTGTPSIGIYAGLGSRRLLSPPPTASASAQSNNNRLTIEDTSFAKALQHGQGFFQRARIMSISTRHGLPPSKDPDGTQNRVFQVNPRTGRGSANTQQQYGMAQPPQQHQLVASFQRGLDGILPEGWLEKHVHALPSVIMVLTRLSSTSHHQNPQLHQQQVEQDMRLLQTLDHLRYSLAPKRQSHIHVVALVDDQVDSLQADTWALDVLQRTQLKSNCISLLRIDEDLHSGVSDGMPTSAALKRLHETVRDASFLYYMTQVKRNKRKHAALWTLLSQQDGGDYDTTSTTATPHPPPLLLPLAVRFCFKIGMFYEFQNKFDKSIKFIIHAYRHLEAYYRFLQQSRMLAHPSQNNNNMNPQQSDYVTQQLQRPTYAMLPTDGSEEGGFEVSLANNNNNSGSRPINVHSPGYKILSAIVPPQDMDHQCRAVADWLNFKVLQAGLKSKSPSGLMAAAAQWRRHSRAFLSILSSSYKRQWYHWSFVAHQRLVMSQLVERHPPDSALNQQQQQHHDSVDQRKGSGNAATSGSGSSGNSSREHMEFLLQCSPWRSYEAATEAMLRLGLELKKVQQQGGGGDAIAGGIHDEVVQDRNAHNKRARYVGSIDREGLVPKFNKELQVSHRDKALELILRAVALFETDMRKATTAETEHTWSRTGARLYYLAGGILLGMERHQEATLHLEKAAKFAEGWRGLELVIRRLLIECYEKHVPEQQQEQQHRQQLGGNDDSSSQTIASMILDSYFNAQMSSRNLRRALENFASHSGGGSLKWYHECVDESDASLPFSFAVTFPGTTHATAGETVKASVVIRSNLDYAVHINTVVLLSMAGRIVIPSNDLLSAKNANEGTDGGIIIQAKKEIFLTTVIKLPKDVNIIAFDESGNGGVLQGVAGKGSFAKAARPRTAGVTSAAGARLVSEVLFGKEPNSSNAQWSLRFLGGRPLRCDGLQLTFYPVYVETASSGGSITFIELTIEKKKPKTAANIRRTPFEEDNYLASAWSRPHHCP